MVYIGPIARTKCEDDIDLLCAKIWRKRKDHLRIEGEHMGVFYRLIAFNFGRFLSNKIRAVHEKTLYPVSNLLFPNIYESKCIGNETSRIIVLRIINGSYKLNGSCLLDQRLRTLLPRGDANVGDRKNPIFCET